uniref:Plexin domain-containing protein 2 n=1 Tax=Cacopsylla melanoneura TaxID=428564 RepID=A0A8D9FA44_9HEMI
MREIIVRTECFFLFLLLACFTISRGTAFKTVYDHTPYYRVNVSQNASVGKALWFDLNDSNSDKTSDAIRITLPFDSLIFGQTFRYADIYSVGSLMLLVIKDQNTEMTHYIKPLSIDRNWLTQLNFRYFMNDTQLTVTWENLNRFRRASTYQVTIYKSGSIAFVYKDFDERLASVEPVIYDFGFKYDFTEYVRVNLTDTKISTWSSITLTPLPTCVNHTDETSCLSTCHLNCSWCLSAKLCSSGEDLMKPLWEENYCYYREAEKPCLESEILTPITTKPPPLPTTIKSRITSTKTGLTVPSTSSVTRRLVTSATIKTPPTTPVPSSKPESGTFMPGILFAAFLVGVALGLLGLLVQSLWEKRQQDATMGETGTSNDINMSE